MDEDRVKAKKRMPQYGIDTELALVEEEAKTRCQNEANRRDMDEKRFSLEERRQERERLQAMDMERAEEKAKDRVHSWEEHKASLEERKAMIALLGALANKLA